MLVAVMSRRQDCRTLASLDHGADAVALPHDGRARRDGAAAPDRGGQAAQHVRGGVEVQARVGDALPVGQRGRIAGLLPPGQQEALQHDPDDAGLARADLVGEVGGHGRLAAVVLAAVAVAGVHHHPPGQPGPGDLVQRLRPRARARSWARSGRRAG